MATKLNVDTTKVVIGGKASGMMRGMVKMLSREAVISGYGAISDTDVGVVATHAYDGYETLRSFNAPALAKEAEHSAFAVFRDAIAEAAENPVGSIGTYRNVAKGEDYTLFYGDLIQGHKAIEADLITSNPDSIDAKLDYANVDWNDPTARADYLKNIQEYAQQVGLRDHAGFMADRPGASTNELSILLHTSSKEEYTAYIRQFEGAIQEHYNAALEAARENARELGYTGKMTDVKAMEKFAATLSPADKGAMDQLIQLTDGKINKVDQFALARISEGHIDIQEVLAGVKDENGVTRHFLNGVELDQKSLHALAALNVFAHSDAVANSYQLRTLEALGGKSEISQFDLNKLKHVSTRCAEFEAALEKSGFGAWQNKGGKFQIASEANKRGVIKGISLKNMTTKQLRTIDLSKIQDKNVRDALKQYINLRDHKDTLAAAKELMGNMQMRITQMTRKILGDSDLSQAIGQIQSQYRNAQFAMKMWVKIGDLFKWIGKTSRARALRKDAKILEKFGRSSQEYAKRMSSKRSGEARQQRYDQKVEARKDKIRGREETKAKTKQSKIDKLKETAKGRKKLAKSAKRAEKKLLRKAGKQGSDLVRNAGRLAKHGSMGTTTAAGSGTVAASAGGGGAAAAGAGGGAAAGAGGGGAAASAGGGAAAGGAGVVLIWIIVIAIIVAAVCTIISGIINVIISAATEFDNTLLGKMVNWIAEFLDNWKWPWEASNEEKENVLWYTMLKLQEVDMSTKNVANIIPAGSVFRGGYAPMNGTSKATEDSDPDTISWDKPEYKSENISADVKDVYYVYTNAITGQPVNEYTNIKTCLSMAHAYTYQIETKKHIENFTTYAIGLWHHLNRHEVTATLSMCPGCGTYTYDCNIDWTCKKGCSGPSGCRGARGHNGKWESAYYEECWECGDIYMTSPGAKINIGLNNRHYFYVVGGTPTDRTASGCIKKIHNNDTGAVTKTDTLNLGRDSSYTLNVVKFSTVFPDVDLNSYENRKYSSSYYGDSSGNYVEWYPDPKGTQECLETTDHGVLGISGTYNVPANNNRFRFCTSSTTAAPCDNYAIKDTYSRKETWKYHGEKRYDGSSINTAYDWSTKTGNRNVYLTTERNCASGYGRHTNGTQYYICKKQHSAPVYCSAYSDTISYTYSYTKQGSGAYYKPGTTYTIEHASTYPCSCGQGNKISNVYVNVGNTYYKPSKTTIYYCTGHTNHGVFDSSSDYFYDCQDYIPPVYNDNGLLVKAGKWVDGYQKWGDPKYECTGYKEVKYELSSTKLYVCLGHTICNAHWDCPNHTLTYCQGHIAYQIKRESVPTNDALVYSEEWTHVVHGKALWFIDTETTYTPKKNAPSGQTSLARKDWSGWTTENKDLMNVVYFGDWYLTYGVGIEHFTGGQLSPYERSQLMTTFKIDESSTTTEGMANLMFAMNSCGQVCYYPNDKAVAEGYSPANKFGTVADKVWDKNKVQRGVHGLDPKYYAAWVYRSTHSNTPASCLETSHYNNPYSVTAATPAGTLIVNSTDSNNIRTGVLIGTFKQGDTLKVRYIGIDTGSQTGGGWVTVITESASGWKYSTAANEQ